MSVNRYLPHVLVLPEDDANRQLANGFLLEPAVRVQSIQVLPEAGGWLKLLENFEADEIAGLNQHGTRFMVLLIDLDKRAERILEVKRRIPVELRDRVFVLGTFTEPEDLKTDLGTYEKSVWPRPGTAARGPA